MGTMWTTPVTSIRAHMGKNCQLQLEAVLLGSGHRGCATAAKAGGHGQRRQ